MPSTHRQSDFFKFNVICWNLVGLWSGRNQSKYYKYYSFLYLLFTLFIYDILLNLNLVYTPRKIEFIIREVIFYFTAINIMSKVLMIIVMRDKIIEAFDLLDSEELGADDENSKQKIGQNYARYQIYLKLYLILTHVGFTSQVLLPIFLHFIFQLGIELPVCKYNFLNDEIRDRYFILWFIYQSVGIYVQMIHSVSIDSFVAGLQLMAIVHCQILNDKIFNLKMTVDEKKLKTDTQEQIMSVKLKKCMKRYDFLLNYCKVVQNIVDAIMFVQFGMSCIIICVVMCGLLLPSSTETYVFMVIYLFVMTMEIFIPAYLGTHLSYESQELVFAAYNTEWIPRSESFKRNIRIFVGRANIPIQMSGLKMFPLSLTTFTLIMKTAYSFFTLIRNFQHD